MSNESTIYNSKRLLAFFPLAITAALLFYLFSAYAIEPNSPLLSMLPLLGTVFLLNYWLPVKARPYLLSAASCIAAFFALNPLNASALILLMLGFSAFLSLRISWKLKFAGSFLLIVSLALFRKGFVNLPFVPYITPIAGSLLMFRLLAFLYEQKFTKPQSNFAQNFSYLFLLPNFALPLFPIIDYKTYLRSNSPDTSVVSKGISRMMLGLAQLLAYRYVHNVIIPPLSVVHSSDAALHYILTGYLAILHLTGLLWLAAGYLGALGFDLPPIFNNVFLVSSFADIWRRINTYWREFVMKLFYYPVYFRIRKKVKRPVLFAALITFAITGLLHGWQWFWLQGSIVLQPTGMIYWLVLGICISISLAMQEKKSTAVVNRSALMQSVIRVLKITGMYFFMSFLWSLWNSPSVRDWIYLLKILANGFPLRMIGFILVLMIAGVLIDFFSGRFQKKENEIILLLHKWPVSLVAGLVMLAFLLTPDIASPNYFPGKNFAADIYKDRQNLDEREEATENYYSRMLASDGQGRRPWEVTVDAPVPKSGFELACTRRHDMLMRELIPSKETDLGSWKMRTNRWGMRDKEYSKEKPADVYRIAILGASYEMGSGVAQDSVFDNLLEKMLNDSLSEKRRKKYEVLNFAVGGYHPAQQVWVMENKVRDFHPDLVLQIVHPEDRSRNNVYMSTLVHNGYDLVYPELNNIRYAAGAMQYMGMRELQNRFEPFNNAISIWAEKQITENCLAIHAQFCVVYTPSLLTNELSENEYYYSETKGMKYIDSNGCGYFSIPELYGDHPDQYKLATDATHPNAQGHLRLAGKLYQKLVLFLIP